MTVFIGGISFIGRFPIVGYVFGALLVALWLMMQFDNTFGEGRSRLRDCEPVVGRAGLTCE